MPTSTFPTTPRKLSARPYRCAERPSLLASWLAPGGPTTAKAAVAQAPDDLTHEANLAYDRKEFVTALALYRDAIVARRRGRR